MLWLQAIEPISDMWKNDSAVFFAIGFTLLYHEAEANHCGNTFLCYQSLPIPFLAQPFNVIAFAVHEDFTTAWYLLSRKNISTENYKQLDFSQAFHKQLQKQHQQAAKKHRGQQVQIQITSKPLSKSPCNELAFLRYITIHHHSEHKVTWKRSLRVEFESSYTTSCTDILFLAQQVTIIKIQTFTL